MDDRLLGGIQSDAARRWSLNIAQYDERLAQGIAGEDDDRIARRLMLKGYSYQSAIDLIGLASRKDGGRAGGMGMLERIIAENDLTPIAFLMKGLAAAHAVCRVVVKSATGRVTSYGTGFLISPRLVMTNNHVLESASVAALSVLQFGFMEGPAGEPPTPYEVPLDVAAFFRTHRPLDFTIVAIDETKSAAMNVAGRPWLPLIRGSGKALVKEPLNIIQHPRGEPLRIAFRNNNVVGFKDQFIHYSTDTEPGSSGSPVLNDQWDLVALHHAGVPRLAEDGKTILKRDKKTPYRPGKDSPADIDWIGNEGIRVSALTTYLDGLSMNDREAALYEAAFSPPDWASLLAKAAAGAFKALEPSAPAAEEFIVPAGPIKRADGRTSWFFEFSVGPVVQPPPAPSASVAAPPPASRRPGRVGPDEDLRAAAESLLEHLVPKDESYYDDAKDNLARTAYCAGIRWNLSQAKLNGALADVLRRTHVSPTSYSVGRKRLYAWADAHSTGTKLHLRSVYSGEIMERADVLAEELAVETHAEPELLTMLQEGRFERFFALETLAESVVVEAAEAAEQPPFDCEHVVPQSWFGKAMPMVGDMHHLFTCEKGCNRARGNAPYFDFSEFDGTPKPVDDFEEKVREKCGTLAEVAGVRRFEPQWIGGRSAAARATLYFLLRYPGYIGGTSTKHAEYDKDILATLLAWHAQTAPGEWEKHRNAEIQKIQGNRNPLIDFPDFDWKVGHFEPSLGT